MEVIDAPVIKPVVLIVALFIAPVVDINPPPVVVIDPAVNAPVEVIDAPVIKPVVFIVTLFIEPFDLIFAPVINPVKVKSVIVVATPETLDIKFLFTLS